MLIDDDGAAVGDLLVEPLLLVDRLAGSRRGSRVLQTSQEEKSEWKFAILHKITYNETVYNEIV